MITPMLAQVLRTRQDQHVDGFHLWPARATTMAADVDWLFIALLGMTVVFTLLIFVLITTFALKYRRRIGHQAVQVRTRPWLEVTWTLVPTVIVLGLFVWSARVFAQLNSPPPDAMRIDVVGKQWMWKIQHPSGRREINELHIPTGRPVELTMTSEDTIHSFYLPAARVKHDVLPGRYTSIWFQATQPGEYRLLCAEYCGTGHSKMGGKLIVMTPAEYEAWLSGGPDGQNTVSTADAGAKLFELQGCATCHGQYGPSLAGVYGRTQKLSDGTTVVADDGYLRESILYPNAKHVAGYPPLMPTFSGRLSEEQVMQLIAYLRSLGEVPDAELPSAAPTTEPETETGGTQ